MKTGIIRRIDDLGRVAIPKDIRRHMKIEIGAPLEISVEENKIILELYIPEEGTEKTTTITCKDCIHYAVCDYSDFKEYKTKEEIREKCKDFLPAADVTAIEHGYIIEHRGAEDNYYCECSVCKTHEISLGDNYCSECGARMDVNCKGMCNN